MYHCPTGGGCCRVGELPAVPLDDYWDAVIQDACHGFISRPTPCNYFCARQLLYAARRFRAWEFEQVEDESGPGISPSLSRSFRTWMLSEGVDVVSGDFNLACALHVVIAHIARQPHRYEGSRRNTAFLYSEATWRRFVARSKASPA